MVISFFLLIYAGWYTFWSNNTNKMQDVSVSRSNSNVRDVPVAAVTPFHVNNDTSNNRFVKMIVH